MLSGVSSISRRQVASRSPKGWLKPTSFIVSFALMLGGVILGQTLLAPQAAAQKSGDYIVGWHTDPYTTGSGRMRLDTAANPLDNQTLYVSDASGNIGTMARGGATPTNTFTKFASTTGTGRPISNAIAVSTLAVDADPFNVRGQKYMYFWSWEASGTASQMREIYGMTTLPSTNIIPVARVAAGQTAIEWSGVPAPDDFTAAEGYVSGYNYWSGGEVIQKTGEVFFSGGECSGIKGSFNMLLWNPTTGHYNFSGTLTPASAADDIFGTGDGCSGNGYVASDMALDANGKAYILVGRGSGTTGQRWLVRVTPSETGPWTYNIVTPLRARTGDTGEILTFIRGGNNVWGMAFYNGMLYAHRGTSAWYEINPMSGYVRAMGSNPGGTQFDMASGQTAIVLEGKVYNDANADGSIAGDQGLGDISMAIYQKNTSGQYVFQGDQLTGPQGDYSFLVGGAGDYIIRVVQPQKDNINAVQTYASGGGTLNPVVAKCYNGDITSRPGSACYGAKEQPTNDPPLPTAESAYGNDTSTQPASMMIYSEVKVTTDEEVVDADFAVTTNGSYGDAAAGPASGATVPVHINGVAPAKVFLGDALGAYTGPATNNTAHNSTDDGVYIDSYAGRVLLTDTVLAATRNYTLTAEVNGTSATKYVAAWVTGAGNNTWGTTPKWNPPVVGSTAQGNFQFQTSGVVSGTQTAQMRVSASTTQQNQPTNADREYQAGANGGPNWVTLGEIEDYSFRVADAVYRPAAKTSTGQVGTFIVAGATITTGADLKVGPAVGVSASTAVNLTAVAPNSDWTIERVVIKDTETGAVISNPSFSISGNTASFSYTPGLASDVIIEVTFARNPDPNKSTLTVTPVPQTVAMDVTATATVLSSDNSPLANVLVSFTKKSGDITLSDTTCMTDAAGSCSITLTTTKAATYTGELTATVIVSGAAVQVNGSPATVVFNAEPDPDMLKSTFVVSPVVNMSDRDTWVRVGGSYTGTLTLLDKYDNPIKNGNTALIQFIPSSGDVSVLGITNNNDGTYTATITSTVTSETGTIQARYNGNLVVVDASNTPAVRNIPFRSGPPCATCQGTSLIADPTFLKVGTSSTITATIADEYGNPVEAGYVVTFAKTGSSVLSATTQTTDANGKVVVTLNDNTAETVSVSATVTVNGTPQALRNSPVSVEFYPGPPCTDRESGFTVSPVATADRATWVVANGTATYTGTFTAKDCDGNLLSNLDVSKIVFTPSTSDVTMSAPVVNAGNGNYTVTFKSTKADANTTATVAYDGMVISSGTSAIVRAIPFKADVPFAQNSTLTADRTSLKVGETSYLTVTVKDQNGNPVPGVAVTFTKDSSTAVLTVTAGTTDSDGQAFATLTDNKAEDVNVSATVVINSVATHVTNSPLKVSFAPGPPCTDRESGFTVSPVVTSDQATWVVANGTATYTGTFTAKDCDGNLLSNLDVSKIVFTPSTSDVTMSAPVVNAGNGNYTVTFKSTKADPNTTATVSYDGAVISVGTSAIVRAIPFKAGPPDRQASWLVADSTNLKVGLSSNLTATIVDEYNNPIPGIMVTFTKDSPDAVLVTVNATTDANGKAYATLTDNKAEDVNVRATVLINSIATDIKYSPLKVSYYPDDPCTDRVSEFTVSPVATSDQATWVVANGTSSYTGTFTAKDCNGNLLTNLDVGKITFTPSSSNVTKSSPVVNAGGGNYTVTFTSTKADPNYTAMVAWDGTTITTGAAPVVRPIPFKAGPPNEQTSTLTADKTSLGVNETSTLTATIMDANNNPVPGITVTFSKNSTDANMTVVNAITDADGKAVVTLTDGKAETVQVSATVQVNSVATHIKNSPLGVTFNVGDFCPETSTFTVSPVANTLVRETWVKVSSGSEVYTGVLTAKDCSGNVLTNLDTSKMAFPISITGVTTTAIVNSGNGAYTVTFWSNKAIDNSTVRASYNNVFVEDSPGVQTVRPIPFQTGTIDPNKSTVTVSPLEQVVGLPVVVTITVHDSFDNPITGIALAQISVTAAPPVGVADTTNVTNCKEVGPSQPGVYTCDLTARLVGTYTVTAVVSGTTLNQKPQVQFKSGGVCVSNCTPVNPNNVTRFVMGDNNRLADGIAKDNATAYAYDTYGNPVLNAAVRVVDVTSGTIAGYLTPQIANATTNANGIATVEWTSTKPGVFTGQGTIDGQTPPTSILNQITFELGNVDPTKSLLEVSPATSSIPAGTNYTLTVTTRDVTNNLLPGAVVSFSLSSSDATLSSLNCTTLSDGKCSVTLTSTKAGSYTVWARVTPASGVATNVVNSPATVGFTNAEICIPPMDTWCDPVNYTRVWVSPNNQVANNSSQDIVRILAYDRYGNPVPNVQVIANPSASLTLRTAANPVTASDGTAMLGYSSATNGTFDVYITLNGRTPGGGNPAQLTYGTDLPRCDMSTLSIAPNVSQVVGSTFNVTAHVVDTNNNGVNNVNVSFGATPSLTIGSGATCMTNASGDCSVAVSSQKIGDYVINGYCGGTTPMSNTVTATFTPGPICIPPPAGTDQCDSADSTRVEMVTNGVKPDDTEHAIARVYVRDRYGNPISGATVLSSSANSNLHIQPSITPTGTNGETTIWYSSAVGGTYSANVTVNGRAPNGSPVSPIFGGVADSDKSFWTISPPGPLVVGEGTANTYTATATLLDANYLPVPGAVMNFLIDPSGPVFPGATGASCQAGSNGTCTVTIRSTISGTYSVSANISTGPVKNSGDYSKSIVWSPDEICAELSGCTPITQDPNKWTRVVVTKDNATADGDDFDLATVYAFDKWGNPVPGQLVRTSTTDTDLILQTGIDGTNEQGISTIQYKSAKSGGHVASVQVGGTVSVPGKTPITKNFDGTTTGAGQITLNFVAGTASATQSVLTVTPLNPFVGDAVTVTATIKDKMGNPVPNVQVTFGKTGSSTLTTAAPTNASGVTTVTLNDDVAETVTVTAKVLIGGVATDITNSPTDVTFISSGPHEGNSKVEVYPTSQTAGSPVTVTVTLRDAKNNPINGYVQSDFVMTGMAAGLPNLAFTNFTPGANGTYTFQTTSQLIGVFTIRATVKSVLITDAPTVQFTPGTVCVTNCGGDPDHTTRIVMVVNDQVANGSSKDTARAYAFDTYGNIVTDAVFTVQIVNADGSYFTPITQTTAQTGASGTVMVEWTSTKSGTYTGLTTVRSGAMTNSIEVTNSNLDSIRFAPGNISAARSQLIITPTTSQVVGSSFTATAKVVDGNNNPLTGVTVSFNSGGNSKLTLSGATCETDSNGTCSITVSSVFIGTYQVHATLPVGGVPTPLGGDGDATKSSPQPVTFTASSVCVPASQPPCNPVDDPTTPEDESVTHFTKIAITNDYKLANDSERDTMTVYAYDRYGNPVANVAVVASTTDAALHLVTTTGTTNANGTATFDATSAVASAHPVSALVASLVPQNSPTDMHFLTGPAGSVVLTMNPSGTQPVGSTFTITAKVTDASANPLNNAGVDFNLPANLTAVGGSPSCSTGSNGECTLQVTSTKVDAYAVTASAGTPASNQVTPTFTPGPVSGTNSTAVVTHNGENYDGVSKNYVTVTAKDQYGNPVPGASVTSVAVAGQSNGLTIQSPIDATDSSGQTQIWYTSTAAGAKVATVSLNGSVTPQGSPVTLNFGVNTCMADKSSWVISPTTSLTVGTGATSQFTLTATAKDAFDALVMGCVVSFDVNKTTTAWGATPPSCTTNGNGVCSVTVASTVAGTYAFTASLWDGQIGQAKSAIWTADEVCGPCSTAVVTTNNVLADGNARDIVTVTARDQYNNPVPGQLVSSSGNTASLTVQSSILFTNNSGVSTIWYSSKVAGDHQATVTIGSSNEVPIGAPVTLNFVPGEISAEHSTLTVSSTSLKAGESATATALVRDINDNPVSGKVVTFGSTGASTRSLNTCTTNASGTCSITVYDETAETISISAMVDINSVPTQLKNSPVSVTFTPGNPGICDDPHKTGTNLSASQLTVEVPDPAHPGSSTITAYITDEYCNAVGAGFTVNFTKTGGATLSATSAVTDANSNAIVTLNSGVPATATVSAVVVIPNLSPLAVPSPVTVNFVDTTAPTAPTITGPPPGWNTDQPLVITGTGETGATVEVKDQGGNVVCSATVGATGSWTCSPPAGTLPDNEYTLKATQTDTSGNASPPSAPITIKVKNTPPNKPTIDVANKTEISGTVDVGPNDQGSTVTVKDKTGKVICTTTVVASGTSGTWKCPTPGNVTENTDIVVVVTDPAGNNSDPTDGYLKVIPPVPPTVNPSNGSEVSGIAEPGSKVTVTDGNGTPIPGCVNVLPDNTGKFSCTPTNPIPPDSKIKITATDSAGNKSDPTEITIGRVRVEVMYPERLIGEAQTVTGYNFNPGESICLWFNTEPVAIECQTASDEGTVSFTFVVPEDFTIGDNTIQLIAEKSGSHTAVFTLTAPPEVPTAPTGGFVTTAPSVVIIVGMLTLLVTGTLGISWGLIRNRRIIRSNS